MLSNEYLFSNIGIDSLSFFSPRTYVDLRELAKERNVDPNKYTKGLLSKEMRIPEVDEDVVSLGLKAGYNTLQRGDISPKSIDALFFGNETITYSVKSISNIFAEMLEISPNSITQDIYNACAGGTLAILNSIGLIENGIIKKALIISADISSYNIGSPGEPTQGSGAIGLVISKNPRIAKFSKNFGKVSGNVNDFFRPVNDKNARAFGRYSQEAYLKFQLGAYDDLIRSIGDFHADFYTFHAPYSKLPLKCMQQIILKRWIKHINELPKFEKKKIRSSILKKLDHFLHDVTVLPEYLYLKLKERGFSSPTLEKFSYWVNTNVKERVLPQLNVPMHFGNMYNASLWAQVCFLLENHARDNDTIYFGSYGSGATCISGLLKIQEGFKEIIQKGPHINDFINLKERKSVQEYESIKNGKTKPEIILGYIVEHDQNQNRGFTLHFCDEGCLIPNIKGLDSCPKGHSGFHKRFFPLFAKLDSDPIVQTENNNLNYLKEGLVRVASNAIKGASLEYEIRRVENENEENINAKGLLNWSPIYIPIPEKYLTKRYHQIQDVPITPLE
ncbi:MAG: hydroxymethylglutaryl-CoA synthase family protein [Promethearchaeota archaeon]|nr:MAG: hydroxymethylglutaryl-CoA synthase family protein [Candidatus Lokiarchaeota archaeon]